MVVVFALLAFLEQVEVEVVVEEAVLVSSLAFREEEEEEGQGTRPLPWSCLSCTLCLRRTPPRHRLRPRA